MGNFTLEDFCALAREEEHKKKVLKNNPNFYKKPIFPRVFYVIKHTKNGKDFFMYLHGYSYWTPDGTEHDVDYEWGSLKGATLFDTDSDAYQEIDAIVYGMAGDDIDPKTVRIVPVIKFIKHQYEEYAGPLKAFVDFWKQEFSEWRMMKHWLTNEYGKFGKYWSHPIVTFFKMPFINLKQYFTMYRKPIDEDRANEYFENVRS